MNTFLSSGKRHLIAGGVGSIKFNELKIKNIGDASSNSGKVDFYYSTNNTLETNNDIKLKTITIPNINVNGTYGNSLSITGFDIFGSDANSSVTNGNFFILINLDATDTNNEESGENDNLIALPLSFNSSSTATSKFSETKENNLVEEYSSNNLISLEIYDFTGILIKSSKVNSTKQINKTINELPSSMYIIKTPNEVRKISK